MLSDPWDEGSSESICKAYNKLNIHLDNIQPNARFEKEDSAESMTGMLQQVDRLNLENELLTTPQMSDEQIITTVFTHASERNNEGDAQENEKQVSN